MVMPADRRKYPRFKKNLSVVIQSPFTEGRLETASVSLSGFTVNNVQKYCHVEEILSIELVFPKGTSVFCDARIVSVYPQTKEAGAYKLGLEFLNMSKSDKEILKKYLAYSEESQRDISDYYEEGH